MREHILHQLSFDDIRGTSGAQRWCAGRSRFVPPADIFNPSRCEVVVLPEAEAKAFVVAEHYSRSYVAARYRVGIMAKYPFGKSFLGGVAVFSVPVQNAVIPKYLGVDNANEGVELGRFVLLDHELLSFNAETWLLSRAFKLLRRDLQVKGVVAYADPVPRYNEVNNQVVSPGHAGIIYFAHNGAYLGRSSKSTLLVSRSGRVLSRRAISKVRNDETGSAYVCRQMVELGAPGRKDSESGKEYVDRVLSAGVFQRVFHPGNHVFVWRWDD